MPFWSSGGGGSQDKLIDVESSAEAWKFRGGLDGAMNFRKSINYNGITAIFLILRYEHFYLPASSVLSMTYVVGPLPT